MSDAAMRKKHPEKLWRKCPFHHSTSVSDAKRSCTHWVFQEELSEGNVFWMIQSIPYPIYGFLHNTFNFIPSLQYHLPQTRSSVLLQCCEDLFLKLYSCFVPRSEASAIMRASGTSVFRVILSIWKYFPSNTLINRNQGWNFVTAFLISEVHTQPCMLPSMIGTQGVAASVCLVRVSVGQCAVPWLPLAQGVPVFCPSTELVFRESLYNAAFHTLKGHLGVSSSDTVLLLLFVLFCLRQGLTR